MAAAAWVSKPDLLLGPQPSWFTFQGMRKPPCHQEVSTSHPLCLTLPSPCAISSGEQVTQANTEAQE